MTGVFRIESFSTGKGRCMENEGHLGV